MKKPSLSRRRPGFTLIELLVVITIVAALAALSFAGVNAALKRAKTMKGQAAASAVYDAVTRYYTEYGRLPNFSREIRTDEEEGVELLRILLAEDETEEDNPRGLKFLTVQEGTGRRGGLYYGRGSGAATPVQGLYDPFGQPFTIVLNTDYEDTLTFNLGGRTYNLRDEQVAVYSAGADLELGTTDDILTFQR